MKRLPIEIICILSTWVKVNLEGKHSYLLTYLFINNAKNNIELMQHIITTHFIYIYKHYGNIQITWR